MLPLLLGITLISFAVIHLAPGSPTEMQTTLNPKASLEAQKRLRQLYGLDKPLMVQYWALLTNLICHMALVDGFVLSKKPVDGIVVGNAISILDKQKYLQEKKKEKLTARISDLLTTRSLIMRIAYSLLIYSLIAWIVFLLLSLGKA